MQSIKETAANIAASARSGLEKTKATVEEKVEKATAHDPMQKEMATQKKEERIRLAELDKQEARQQNAAAKQAGRDDRDTAKGTAAYTASGTRTYSTTGTGGGQTSALPGQVVEGWIEVHPVRSNPGVGRTTSHNAQVEGNPHGYGTGWTYG